jgi:hypothetical protein
MGPSRAHATIVALSSSSSSNAADSSSSSRRQQPLEQWRVLQEVRVRVGRGGLCCGACWGRLLPVHRL